MYNSILSSIICNTFTNVVGKHQIMRDGNAPRAFWVSFGANIDHNKESGYRHVDLLLYGPHNYVRVYERSRWNVIPLDDLEEGGDGDTYVKKGKDYINGQSEWKLLCDHDSGWTDGVDRFLRDHEKDIISLNFRGNWFEVVDPKSVGVVEG